jgi:3-hydroxymyristoyl/3-hydroxydecanoyl-(acyl carrier protein) dehydratase
MTLIQLKAAFAGRDWPDILELDTEPHHCRLQLFINPSLSWLEGHFPEQPVVAGVVQTHWAAEFGKALFPLGESFQGIDNLKFQLVILPGQQLQLVLEYLPASSSLKFSYRSSSETFSEGKLVF